MAYEKCTNEECGKTVSYSIIGDGVPGGKELEELICPYCGHVLERRMMSGSFLVSKERPKVDNAN